MSLPLRYGFLTLACATWLTGTTQCIVAYPQLEDFEAVPVWTATGVSPDWAWGAPAHPLINSAGGGVNSWCVGGLTGTFYNLGEQSWIASGCYDMSTLDHPWISLKIFWETERDYDGINLQYSINGGATWANVGAYGDPVDCLNDNWYNCPDIFNLTAAFPRHGWSGRVGLTSGSCAGGFGSGAWLEAETLSARRLRQPARCAIAFPLRRRHHLQQLRRRGHRRRARAGRASEHGHDQHQLHRDNGRFSDHRHVVSQLLRLGFRRSSLRCCEHQYARGADDTLHSVRRGLHRYGSPSPARAAVHL
jgi:hypothetical protein